MSVNLAVEGKSVETRGDDLIITMPEGPYRVSRYSCEIIDTFDGYREFLKERGCKPLGDNVFESSPETIIVIYGGSSFEFLTRLLEPMEPIKG